MLGKKQNVFDDFIAAAEYLIARGYTITAEARDRGGQQRRPAGRRCMTQRPDLFGAVLCAVPLATCSAITSSRSGDYWIPEYGSADDPAQFGGSADVFAVPQREGRRPLPADAGHDRGHR